MNELIYKIARQADALAREIEPNLREIVSYNRIRDEKFAELIVKECIERGNDLAKHYINNHSEQEQVFLLASIADYSNEIKKHFGVED